MAKKCPVCVKGKMLQEVRVQTYIYKHKRLKYDQPGLYCSNCKEVLLDNSDMQVVEPLLYDFRAAVDGYLSTNEVRRIRKKLRLTQAQAAEVFGGGHNAFSRYERGQMRPSKATDSLLRLLDKYPHLLKELPRTLAA